jgi:hypothetical protein
MHIVDTLSKSYESVCELQSGLLDLVLTRRLPCQPLRHLPLLPQCLAP